MSLTVVLDEMADLLPGVARGTHTDSGHYLHVDEVTLRVTANEAGYSVEKMWRDEDRGTVFRGADTDDVEIYLLSVLANDVRRGRGLPPKKRRLSLDDDGRAVPADGFTLRGDPDAGFELSRASEREVFFFASDIEAARFSYLVELGPHGARAWVLDGDDAA